MDIRTIKRITYILVLVVLFVILCISNILHNKKARELGYADYKEQKQTEQIEIKLEKYKKITFIDDGFIKKDSGVIQHLEENGYEVDFINASGKAFTDNSYVNAITTPDITILNSNSIYGFINSVDKAEFEKTADGFISFFDDKTIVIIDPMLDIDIDSDDINVDNYKFYIDTIINTCDKYNVAYINLYEHTKDEPIKVTKSGMNSIDEDDVNFINDNLDDFLENITEQKRDELKGAIQ